jgi:hypothetical protein
VVAEKLTWDEIKRRYPDEYVVLVDAEWDGSLPEVRAGVVLGHAKTNEELVASTKGLVAGREIAILFTGEVRSGNYLF